MNEAPERQGSGVATTLVLMCLVVAAAVLFGRPLLEQVGGLGGTAAEPLPEPSSTRVGQKPSGRKPGVVNIEAEQGLRSLRSAGTGIVLTRDGLVLTNSHVISGATSITGTVTDTRRAYPAEVVGYDHRGDLAVIRLTGASGLAPARFGDSAGVMVGDPVTAVGNAGGKGGAPTVVTGEVRALNQTITARNTLNGGAERLVGLIETSAPIRPGDSGGPLLGTDGLVIGVNTAASAANTRDARDQSAGSPSPSASRTAEPRGYAIPAQRALEVSQQIREGRASESIHIGRTALLGVQVRPNGAESGALVDVVVPGTPAASAGLRPGMVIVALGGQPVDGPSRLTALMLAHRPETVVRLEWTTPSGDRHAADVRLAEGPPQ